MSKTRTQLSRVGTLIGLTREGAHLDMGMQAVFGEFAIAEPSEQGEPGIRTSPGGLEEIKKRFDDLWRPFRIKRDPLKVDIIAFLAVDPKPKEEIIDEIMEHIPELNPHKIERALEALLKAGLLTYDEESMWIQE